MHLYNLVHENALITIMMMTQMLILSEKSVLQNELFVQQALMMTDKAEQTPSTYSHLATHVALHVQILISRILISGSANDDIPIELHVTEIASITVYLVRIPLRR